MLPHEVIPHFLSCQIIESSSCSHFLRSLGCHLVRKRFAVGERMGCRNESARSADGNPPNPNLAWHPKIAHKSYYLNGKKVFMSWMTL